LKSLIIIKPSAIAQKALGLIFSRIENEKVTIISAKTMNFDIHLFDKKIIAQESEEIKEKMSKAKRIPCILIVIKGEDAVNVGQHLKKEFGDLVHVSLNEETAKYEMNRFFEKKELFENEENDFEYFLEGKNHSDFKNKSIREIAIEAVDWKKK
jgi:nucleoside diphosphate kinase